MVGKVDTEKFTLCPKSLYPPAREKLCRTGISNKSCMSRETLHTLIVSQLPVLHTLPRTICINSKVKLYQIKDSQLKKW